jgi:hypothetical protein
MNADNNVVIRFTNDFQEACDFRDAGYEPIECAFGQFGSVMGEHNMDHHGLESHREGVAIRACRDLYGARKDDQRFVVTGTPDADAVLAIIALGGLAPEKEITASFYELVNAHDTDPIGIDLMTSQDGVALAWFNQLPNMSQSEDGFHRAVAAMIRLLKGGVSLAETAAVQKSDLSRRKRATAGILARFDANGGELPTPDGLIERPVLRGQTAMLESARILVVNSTVWGFDVWYRAAPIVVSFSSRLQKVTVGCPDMDTAQALFGPDGLAVIWKAMGRGWGGRETIGGSPRGVKQTLADTMATAREIIKHLQDAQ